MPTRRAEPTEPPMTTPPERPPGTDEPDEESWVAQLTATEPAAEREADWDEVFAAEQAAADAALAAEVARQSVTVVLVSHDGARWLPGTLAGLAAQTHRPDRIVAVDTGSTDGSVRLLTEALGEHSVFAADRTTGFGAAVQRALTLSGGHATGWVWILHDDCAPDPDALEQLLRAAVSKPGARGPAWGMGARPGVVRGARNRPRPRRAAGRARPPGGRPGRGGRPAARRGVPRGRQRGGRRRLAGGAPAAARAGPPPPRPDRHP